MGNIKVNVNALKEKHKKKVYENTTYESLEEDIRNKKRLNLEISGIDVKDKYFNKLYDISNMEECIKLEDILKNKPSYEEVVKLNNTVKGSNIKDFSLYYGIDIENIRQLEIELGNKSKLIEVFCYIERIDKSKYTVAIDISKLRKVYKILSLLGYNIIVFNANKESINKTDDVQIIELKNKLNEDVRYPESKTYITDAYSASKEIESVIYNNELITKEGSITDMENRTLVLTIDEVLMLWNTEARVRPYFEVDLQKKKAYVPNIIVQIDGVGDEYKDLISKLIECNKNSLIVGAGRSERATTDISGARVSYGLSSELSMDDLNKLPLDKEKVVKRSLNSMNIHSIHVFGKSQKVLEMINTFNYTGDIPKIIVIQEQGTVVTEKDMQDMKFLNLLGFDIIILNPCCYRSAYDINAEGLCDYKFPNLTRYKIGNPDYKLSIYRLLKNKESLKSRLFNIFK